MPAPASTSPPKDDVGKNRSSDNQSAVHPVGESGAEVESAATQPYVAALEAAAEIAAAVRARCAENGSALSAGRFTRLSDLIEAQWHLAGQRHAAAEIENAIRALAAVPATEPVRQDAVSKTDEHKELP